MDWGIIVGVICGAGVAIGVAIKVRNDKDKKNK